MTDLDLLDRIARGERRFSHPSRELVAALLQLRALGYIDMLDPVADSLGDGWYFAAATALRDAGKVTLRSAGIDRHPLPDFGSRSAADLAIVQAQRGAAHRGRRRRSRRLSAAPAAPAP